MSDLSDELTISKDMSYCTIEIRNHVPYIVDWAIINLFEATDSPLSSDPTPTCTMSKKNKAPCTRRAKYQVAAECSHNFHQP